MLFFADKKKLIVTDKQFKKLKHASKVKDMLAEFKVVRSLGGLDSITKDFLDVQCVNGKTPSLSHVVIGNAEIGYALTGVEINDIVLFYIVNKLKFSHQYDDKPFFIGLLYLFGFVDNHKKTIISKKPIKINNIESLFIDKAIMHAALSTKELIRINGF